MTLDNDLLWIRKIITTRDNFSEDIDIAVINVPKMTGNQVKTLIRDVEKTISADLTEIADSPVTSKGSQYRKTLFTYPKTTDDRLFPGISDKLLIEINSFANPYPFEKREINSLVGFSLSQNKQSELIIKYGLEPFSINILDKRQTLVEKLVSLLRSSFDSDPIISLQSKIRHFYDLYFLYSEKECKSFIDSGDFTGSLIEVWKHDQAIFNEPLNWQGKSFSESLLVNNFPVIWEQLKSAYSAELSALAYSKIPDEKMIAGVFSELVSRLNRYS